MYIVDAVPWQVNLDCKADFMDNKLFHFVRLTAGNQEGMWIRCGLECRDLVMAEAHWCHERPLQTHQVCPLVLCLRAGLGIWRSTFILGQ